VNAGTLAMHDDGLNGDVTAGDHIYSTNVTVGPAATGGSQTLTATVTDAQARTGSGTTTFTVVAAPGTFEDMGTWTPTHNETRSFTKAANEVHWYKVV